MRRIKSFSTVADSDGTITQALSTDGVLFELVEKEVDGHRLLLWSQLPDLPQEGYRGDTEMLAAAEMMKHVPNMVGSMIAGAAPRVSDSELSDLAGLQCRFLPCEYKAADPEDMEHHVRTIHLPEMGR